ncbi:hypothetical protein B0H66DRAFT_624656 [Apodospora peruviana]|uniref:Uncharacterized protein n=1 Tax=Apodospora peruviana TaxID=516989 RepID=A0AAE0M1T5_9PEZI|nr:hypothetical protein B0H66DRAFT_624656 [Apodospora peruviana]
MRTGGLAGSFNGLCMIWRHGDTLSVLSDALVIAAVLLVAIAGKTVGLKLRGTCTSINMSTCFVTVAAFSQPARVAEALLSLLMVIILALGFVLGNWRTGIAAHPSSLASLGVLMQIPETRQMLTQACRGIEMTEGRKSSKSSMDGQLAERFRRECSGIRFRLG